MDWELLSVRINGCDIDGVRDLIFNEGKLRENVNVHEISPRGGHCPGGVSVLHLLAQMYSPRRGHGYSQILDFVELMQDLVYECGADVNCVTDEASYSRTPLHYACAMAHAGAPFWHPRATDEGARWYLAIVEALVAFGADIEATTRSGLTPLAYAICHSRSKGAPHRIACVELLLDSGASLRRAKAALRGKLPPWVEDLAKQRRENARNATIAVIGSRRFGRSPVMSSNAKDVIGLIGRYMLDTRDYSVWKPK